MSDELEPAASIELTSPDDCYFLDAWNRSFEASVARMNDALSRLVTLSTAMAGGAILLLKEDVCYGWWRVIAAGFFFLALASATVGAIPITSSVRFDPKSVRAKFADSAQVKKRWVVLSSCLLLAGLLAALIGATIRAGR